MVTIHKVPATVEDLYHVPENGKAELVEGELRLMAPTGDEPIIASGNIFFSLKQYQRAGHPGLAITDNGAYIVDLPNRTSFSPDASYFLGERAGMKFFTGAPVFAVEVRSENQYSPAAERDMAAKRADYFAAGTLVVWDVDLIGDDVVRVYRSDDPETPTIYRRGEVAEAEPAVPYWTMPVDELFE